MPARVNGIEGDRFKGFVRQNLFFAFQVEKGF